MLQALTQSLTDAFHPKMLALIVWPIIGAAAVLIGVICFTWAPAIDALHLWISTATGSDWVGGGLASLIGGAIGVMILPWLVMHLSVALALLVTSIFGMPIIVNFVAARYYPQLERRRGGSFWGGVLNSMIATVGYLFLLLLTLPLWLLIHPALFLPLLLAAGLNLHLFRYDALAEHADRDEYHQLIKNARGEWFGLGLASALLGMVPVLNVLVPVFCGLSFTHYGLARLAKLRAE